MVHHPSRVPDSGDRAARAETILRTAADLLCRHGYRRVTIDDVATQAAIGKGTVYLHWKSRGELFQAVLSRESSAAIDELLGALRGGMQAWRLHQFARAYFLAIVTRPLLLGALISDRDLLGALLTADGQREARHQLVAQNYVEILGAAGLVRKDMSARASSDAFLASFEGFVHVEAEHAPVAPASRHPPSPATEARAELLAQTVRRAFEEEPELTADEQREIADQVIDLLAGLQNEDLAPRAPRTTTSRS